MALVVVSLGLAFGPPQLPHVLATSPLRRVTPLVLQQPQPSASEDAGVSIDKQMSNPKLIRFSSVSDEFKPLCEAARALARPNMRPQGLS